MFLVIQKIYGLKVLIWNSDEFLYIKLKIVNAKRFHGHRPQELWSDRTEIGLSARILVRQRGFILQYMGFRFIIII